MRSCVFCNSQAGRYRKYGTFDVCDKCYLKLGIDKVENKAAPHDEYMKSIVMKDDVAFVDALNLYAALFPKRESVKLFGLFLANIDDSEMNDLIINSMIIAARAVLIFGDDEIKDDMEPEKEKALIRLGYLVGVTIIGHFTGKHKGLDPKNETEVSKLFNDINLAFIDILDDIKKHDDGSLEDYINRTTELIKTSDMFNRVV